MYSSKSGKFLSAQINQKNSSHFAKLKRFAGKVVVDIIFIMDSSIIRTSMVGIDACLLYPNSLFQDTPTGLYTRWELDCGMQKLNARHKRSRNFENTAMAFYEETRLECRIESFHTSGN